jgi:hypothetical protein
VCVSGVNAGTIEQQSSFQNECELWRVLECMCVGWGWGWEAGGVNRCGGDMHNGGGWILWSAGVDTIDGLAGGQGTARERV